MHSITQEAKDTLIGAMNEYFSKPAQVKFSSQSELEDAIAYDVVALIKQIPVSDGWIPVSERLPEDCETVIATDGENSVPVTYINKLFYFIGSPAQFYLVTAWQPLPNPPTSHK